MVGYLILPDGREVAARDGLVLGRVAGCDVVVNDTKASRRHAALRVAGSVVEIEDLDSSNGTLLNGKKVQRRMLRDGDKIQIGAWAISYRDRAGAPAVQDGSSEELSFADDAPAAASAPAAVPKPRPEPRAPASPAPAPPPPSPAAKPPSPAPAASELEFLDEVVQLRTPAQPSPSANRGASAPQPAAAVKQRGVLQFHRTTDRRGVLAEDMQQMSGLQRGLLVLFALAVAGIVGYLTMQLVR